MAQVEVPGGGTVLSNGKRIERRVVVSTTGAPLSVPPANGQLQSASGTREAGGLLRGVFEFVQSDLSTGGADGFTGGRQERVEVIGGSREVPVQRHPKFKDVTSDEIKAITEAVDRNDPSLLPEEMGGIKDTLYEMLQRQVRYYLVPAVTARITTLESRVPSLGGIGKLAEPTIAGIAEPNGTRWVLTGISASSVGRDFEVTREHTLTADDVNITDFLYS